MIVHDVEQGSIQWIEARLSIPTASEAHRILTPTGKLSAQAQDYACRLIVEGLLRQQTQDLDNLEWVSHGKMSEPDAVQVYEFTHDIKTTKVGFITTDDGQVGASPDRLIGKNGLEIKSPSPQVHLKYLLFGLGEKYKPQVQTQNYVCEFEWTDFYSHNLDFTPVEIKTYRDEPYIKALAQAFKDFNDMKADMLHRIKTNGFFVERERIMTAVDAAYGHQEF